MFLFIGRIMRGAESSSSARDACIYWIPGMIMVVLGVVGVVMIIVGADVWHDSRCSL